MLLTRAMGTRAGGGVTLGRSRAETASSHSLEDEHVSLLGCCKRRAEERDTGKKENPSRTLRVISAV